MFYDLRSTVYGLPSRSIEWRIEIRGYTVRDNFKLREGKTQILVYELYQWDNKILSTFHIKV